MSVKSVSTEPKLKLSLESSYNNDNNNNNKKFTGSGDERVETLILSSY